MIVSCTIKTDITSTNALYIPTTARENALLKKSVRAKLIDDREEHNLLG